MKIRHVEREEAVGFKEPDYLVVDGVYYQLVKLIMDPLDIQGAPTDVYKHIELMCKEPTQTNMFSEVIDIKKGVKNG